MLPLECFSIQEFGNTCQVLRYLQRKIQQKCPGSVSYLLYLSRCLWGVGNSCRDGSKSLCSLGKLHGINPLPLGSSVCYKNHTWLEAFMSGESKTLNKNLYEKWVDCLSSSLRILWNNSLCSHFPFYLLRESLFWGRVLRLSPNSGMLITDFSNRKRKMDLQWWMFG